MRVYSVENRSLAVPRASAVTPSAPIWVGAASRARAIFTNRFVVQIAAAFLAYYVAGKLGQATTNIRSGNLGPVWPASGAALAVLLAGGYRLWPGLALGSFMVAYQSPVFAITAAGQSLGATLSAVLGTFLLRRVADFDPRLSRLKDAIALIVLGAFVSATASASIGLLSLYATGFQAYSGLTSAWLIYWLGDAAGVLLVTPLVFTLPGLLQIRSRPRLLELAALLVLLVGACFMVFAGLPLLASRLLGFAVLPFVMWAAISFGISGASLSVFLIATIATLLTMMGIGAFSSSGPLVNAVLLDVLFVLLAISGLSLGAVIDERERAKTEREDLIRAQAAIESRLRLAAIVESSNDAILSTTLDGVILSWNAAAQRIFGFSEAEAIGRPMTLLIPPELHDEDQRVLQQVRAGRRVPPYETIRMTKTGKRLNVSVTMSPLHDADGRLIGSARVLRDITEQKRAADALSNVSRRLIEAQEQERSRIARELHDDIGQRLSLLAVNLAGVADDSPVRLGAAAHGVDLEQQASEIAADVQALSHRLHSPRLELLGLSEAMRHFCDELGDQQRVIVTFERHEVPDRLPPDVSTCLFRILQEALHNCAKHSGVREFGVRLWAAGDRLHLTVEDGGKGFDLEAASTSRGIGLIGMAERVKLIDGELSIDSAPGRGTLIHAQVPLRNSPGTSSP